MAIPIKSPDEIAQMRVVGGLAFGILRQLAAACRAGRTTRELADLAEPLILDAHAVPTMKGFPVDGSSPFPGAACICVNEESFHALPGDRIIRDGDIVTIDLVIASRDGWHVDVATSVAVGEVASSKRARALADTARRATQAIIDSIGPGARWAECIGPAIKLVRDAGFFIGSSATGHGVGRVVHEHPAILFPVFDPELRLWPGMVITVEPVIMESSTHLLVLDDGWTVVARDRAWSAFEERTVAVTRDGVEILTA